MNPDENSYFPKFIDKMILCASLKVDYYEDGICAVHQSLVLFTTVQPSDDWLKATLGYKYGSIFIKVLRNQISVEVNATRNITKAERLRDSLCYNNESSITFEIFISKCQKK